MKQTLFFLFFLLAMLPGCLPWSDPHTAPDVIQEISHISDIYNYMNENDYNAETLVMLDIDNTLLSPQTDLGSDQWFYAMFKRKIEEGLSEQEAIYAILPVYKQVLQKIDYVPIEKDTVTVVKNLQKKGVTVIGFTARSIDLAYRTIEQLHKAGIVFDTSDPHECPIQYGSSKPALYIDGIIFTGNYSKGEVVASWLKQIDYRPKKVIFVDDKLKNVKSVEKALHKRDFPFYGLRYNYLDKRVKQFNWETTQKELEQFLEQYPESRPIPAH